MSGQLDGYSDHHHLNSVKITVMTNNINEEEKQRRAEIISETNYSMYLSGFVLSAECKALQNRYISGEITIKELGALTRAMCGIK